MTIEYESKKSGEFIAGIEAIQKASSLRDSFTENLSKNKALRNAEYAKLTEPLLENCKHKELLDSIESQTDRVQLLCHIADVVYRSAIYVASEENLTLDDVLCLSVAAYRRKLKDPNQTTDLGKYLKELDLDDIWGLQKRFVEYQLANIPQEYEADDKDTLASVLNYQFCFGQTLKGYGALIEVDPRIVRTRVEAFRAHERENLLAILYTSGNVELSIQYGINAYKGNYTALSKGKPFAPNPLKERT